MNNNTPDGQNLSYDPRHPVRGSNYDGRDIQILLYCAIVEKNFDQIVQRGAWLAVHVDCPYCGAAFRVVNDWGDEAASV